MDIGLKAVVGRKSGCRKGVLKAWIKNYHWNQENCQVVNLALRLNSWNQVTNGKSSSKTYYKQKERNLVSQC